MKYQKYKDIKFIKDGANLIGIDARTYLNEKPNNNFVLLDENSIKVKMLSRKYEVDEIINICIPILYETWNPNEAFFYKNENKFNDYYEKICLYTNDEYFDIILQQLSEKRFLSLFENFRISFKISGIPRTITHQIVRHRKLNFSQESFSVSDIRKNDFTINEQIAMNPEFIERYKTICILSKMLYSDMIDSGKVTPEFARDIIPMGISTDIIINGNIGDIIQYINQRKFGEAMNSHRIVAKLVVKELISKNPNLWLMVKDLVKFDIENDRFEE